MSASAEDRGGRGRYRTIVADPPWAQPTIGKFQRRQNQRPDSIPYETMTLEDIKRLPVGEIAERGAHLWLWTTNAYLRAGFEVMEAWGFTYLAPITWVKPSGCGAYFIHRTQTILFGYRERCEFPLARYQPNVLFAPARRHSAKPEALIDFVETISPEPRIELFARRQRLGWATWGNECFNTVTLEANDALAI